jgi:hypothetical protein
MPQGPYTNPFDEAEQQTTQGKMNPGSQLTNPFDEPQGPPDPNELSGEAQREAREIQEYMQREDTRNEIIETAIGMAEKGLPVAGDQIGPLVERGAKWIAEDPQRARAAMEIGGGILGGMAPVPGARAAALGRYGPTIWRALQAGLGEATGGLAAESFDPSGPGYVGPALRAVKNFGYGAGGELVGGALFRAGEKVLAPAAKSADETAQEAQQMISERGGQLTAGQLSDSYFVDLMENIAEGSFLGGGRIQRIKQNSDEIAQDIVRDTVRFLGSGNSRAGTGKLMSDVLSGNQQAFQATADTLFKFVDQKAGDASVNLAPVKRQAKQLLDPSQGKKSPVVQSFVRELVENHGNKVSFQEAQKLRSDYLAYTRQNNDPLPGKTQSQLEQLSKAIDSQMDSAAKTLGEEPRQLWRLANNYYKKGAEQFNSRVMKRLTDADPEQVYTELVGNQALRPSRIKMAKEMITKDPSTGKVTEEGQQLWRNIQGRYLMDLISKASEDSAEEAVSGTQKVGEISGKSLVKRFNNADPEAMRALFGENLNDVKSSLNTLRRAQAAASSDKTGRMFIQLTQAGAAADLAGMLPGLGGYLPNAGSFTIILGPPALASLVGSKTGAKWLSTGLKAPPGSRQASRATAQVLSQLQKEGTLTDRGERFLEDYKRWKRQRQAGPGSRVKASDGVGANE